MYNEKYTGNTVIAPDIRKKDQYHSSLKCKAKILPINIQDVFSKAAYLIKTR